MKRIFKRLNMEESNAVVTPLETGFKLSKDMNPSKEEGREEMREVPYRQAIGSLLFLASRPDICFAGSAMILETTLE